MPTWHGLEFLDRVLAALDGQVLDLPWDLHVIDSGSTDGTWERLQSWQQESPVDVHLARIHNVEFDHGDTRNMLAASSKGDLLVFITQDAIPGSPTWLADLARNFEDEQVGAAYCRNIPRPDARLSTMVISATDPGYARERRVQARPAREVYDQLSVEERRHLFNFNDVASALRRELWERHPFPRANFGEDVLQARALIEAGFNIVYDADAVVEHSHDYNPDQAYRRAYVDGRFNAEWLDRVPVADDSAVRILVERCEEQDAATLAELPGGASAGPEVLAELGALRSATFQGLLDGGRTGVRHARTSLREAVPLKILYVVHGFPPDTWAGTEVYTLSLAREMQRRGHSVCVLTRSPARSEDEADFEVIEDTFEGLRVLRLVHRLEHGSLRESFNQPRAEAAFRRVLLREQPDVVHFQHLIHLSAGLVPIAKGFGLATVVTCHDYWALCPRVQMIRPDGALCPEAMGSGCYACVKERGLAAVPAMHAADRLLAPAMLGLAHAAESGVLGDGLVHRGTEYLHLRERQSEVPAAYAAADLRISPSRFLRDMYLDSGHFDPHRFLFSDNGMRTDHVSALEKTREPKGRIRFGFIGTLVWYKGGEALIRAMQRLEGSGCVLNVHGSWDPEGDEHHRLLQDLAGDNVNFLGRFDNSLLAEVYAEIDVLVVPSIWYENSPVTIHEAFLCGTPVVASDIGGMAEYVRDGVDGLQFKMGDDVDLARVMQRFVDEPDLLESLRQEFPEIKTIDSNGAETEFRYRALACMDRTAEVGPHLLLERPGPDSIARNGEVEPQGPDMLLLRPGANAEYSVMGLAGGPVQVVVDVFALGVEPDVLHGGQLLLDGEVVGEMPPRSSAGEDEILRFVLDAELSATAQRLQLSAMCPGEDAHPYLRIKRVAIQTRPRGLAAAAAAEASQ
ncbi:MAG: glycosyltransferase involved in cell wall biosynthesis [Planctomycetota bacterium]|jgi:glycosyltransferase involved in cell wall biosynthesis